ncbi:MAG TPA: replicative DNA helicase [Candidatus Paceibacterota bacterium]|nr:replicative DNA helicase [Candidatus Paceibacterota bacterium]
MADRVPPQDLDIERALLGALMLNANAMYEVSDIVRPDSFYASKHRTVFDAMLALHQKGEPVDLVSLSGKLKEKKQLEQVGGSAYLSELVNGTPSTTSVRHYAQVIQSKYMLRSLIEAAARIGDLGFDEEREIEQILDEAQAAVFAVANSPTLRKFTSMKEGLTDAWERLERLQKQKDGIRGVPTGFAELDRMLSGFQPSDLVILAARPSMGKSAFALDIARKTAIQHGTAVGIFALEMSTDQLVDRMLAAEARVDSWKLRTGKIQGEDDFMRLQEAMERLNDAPIYIDDNPGATVLQMRATARRLKSEKGLGLVIIDYLQLISPTGGRASDSLVQQVTEISRSLKMMARELQVPVLALSQLSRAVEQRRGRPRLSDLRDSGSIEQDADVVMFIHREDMMGERSSNERNNIVEILVEKHRNGPVGKIDLYFDEKYASLTSVEKNEFSDFDAQAAEASMTAGPDDAF